MLTPWYPGLDPLLPCRLHIGDAALVASVLNSQAAQSGELPGALMRAYVAADHVVNVHAMSRPQLGG